LEFNIRKRKRASRSGRFFTSEDLGFLLRLPVFATVSLLVPEKSWRRVCLVLERLKRPSLLAGDIGVRQDLAAFGAVGGEDWRRIGAMRSEHNIQIVRERLVGWKPEIELYGLEHLEAARNKGHGAVLWIAHFAFNALAAKMVFSKAGFEVFQVSRPEHGFSKSRFGIRFINPSEPLRSSNTRPGGSSSTARTPRPACTKQGGCFARTSSSPSPRAPGRASCW
jgi:hypothetical protein